MNSLCLGSQHGLIAFVHGEKKDVRWRSSETGGELFHTWPLPLRTRRAVHPTREIGLHAKSGQQSLSVSAFASSPSLQRHGKHNEVRLRSSETWGELFSTWPPPLRTRRAVHPTREIGLHAKSGQQSLSVSAFASSPSLQRHGRRSEVPAHGELYGPLVEHMVRAMEERMEVWDYPCEKTFETLTAEDSRGQPAVTKTISLQSKKLRNIRSCNIVVGKNLEVLNLVAFPRVEYDLPFFCADFVTMPKGHLLILDINPLHRTEEYLDKYIRPVLPECNEWIDQFPWGGELTGEALQFFSPAVIWTRPPDLASIQGTLNDAFDAYLRLWLDMVDRAEPATDPAEIEHNRSAQHKYMHWRCEKDPGRPILSKLYGTELCERFIHEFLFAEIETMSDKTFLDYFPEYQTEDGSISRKRSVMGKIGNGRPWDREGRVIPRVGNPLAT